MLSQFTAKSSLTRPVFSIAQLYAATTTDPLIDKGGQNIVFLGVALLAIAVVTVVGIISPRVEYAIITAAVLSLGLIGLFFVIGH